MPFDTRVGAAQFQAPDMSKYVEQLPLKSPADMSDLYELSFDEILDVLEALGNALDFDSNAHLQEAYEASLVANVLPPEMMQNSYRILQPLFSRTTSPRSPTARLGSIPQWMGAAHLAGRPRTTSARVRIPSAAYPGRQRRISVGSHHPAIGDHPMDVIIKAPSNDPLTAIAIARTLADVAESPDHRAPGGRILEGWRLHCRGSLYQPHHIEKIVAWGGLASVKHVTRYIQPGLELIALDPKRSATIIGREASMTTTRCTKWPAAPRPTSASRTKKGANARVIYVLSGTDADGLANANRLGESIYQSSCRRPPSSAPRRATRTANCSTTWNPPG